MWLSSVASIVTPLLKTPTTPPKDVSLVFLDGSFSTIPHNPFRLPITYVSNEHLRPLSPIIVQDLELAVSPTKSMYEIILQPTHAFGKQMIPEWSQQFSTDVVFLQDTQKIITEMPRIPATLSMRPEMCNRLSTIWKDVHHPDFLEKYNFMEWNCLKFLNQSSYFLQLMSIGNLMSPVISLFIPILFLILPFIILKIQGLTLTFEMYMEVLKRLAKNHFIGKAIMSLESFSLEKLLYLFAMLGLYLMQIYQNIVTCQHFYENTRQMNNDLVELNSFVTYSCTSIDTFVNMHGSKTSYTEFCRESQKHSHYLHELKNELDEVSKFRCSVQKLSELGYMLKCYYRIYSNETYRHAIQYAIGFEGYMDNLRGISRHWLKRTITMISLKKRKKTKRTKFIQQYYPGLLSSDANLPDHRSGEIGSTRNGVVSDAGTKTSIPLSLVKNTVSLSKNMIITGPNASGKTTLLKTSAINLIFSQQFGCGFYSEGSMLPKPYTHIHSYLNIPDTSERDSLFQAEARRCKNIIDAVTTVDVNGCDHLGSTESTNIGHHFCIFDELYSGTNPKEASKAAYAFLKYLAKRKNVHFMLTTHYVGVCKKFEEEEDGENSPKESKMKHPRIANFKMNVLIDPNTKRMNYTYCIQPGISTVEGAGKILEDMNYPQEIMGDFKNID
jgi:MutS domain V